MTDFKFIQSSTDNPISFHFMAVYSFIVYTYHIFFIYSSVDGHLSCSCVLAIVKSAAVNTGALVSFCVLIFAQYMASSGRVPCTVEPGGLQSMGLQKI